MLRILIVDDHEIVRRGIKTLIETRPEWQIVGEACNGREAVQKAAELQPDLILLDISMPESSGIEAIHQIRETSPESEILVLTMHTSEAVAREVLGAGAHGYVLKSDAGRDLLMGIEALAAHRVFFSRHISEMVLNGYLGKDGGQDQGLTRRERQILQLLAQGKSNREVSEALKISLRTVETHRSHLMTKLSCSSLQELVYYALRNNLVTL